MPLAYILVAMIVLLAGYYASEAGDHAHHIQVEGEAGAVAGNMIAYRGVISDYAMFRGPDNRLVNYDRYKSFAGPAEDFIEQTVEEHRPESKSWFNRINGVKGWIEHGELYIFYDPPTQGISPSKAGVQAALLKVTQNSQRVGSVSTD